MLTATQIHKAARLESQLDGRGLTGSCNDPVHNVPTNAPTAETNGFQTAQKSKPHVLRPQPVYYQDPTIGAMRMRFV